MLKRTIKQTKETLDGSIKAGNNQERTDTLTEQVAILEEYLPKQVEGDELAAPIEEVSLTRALPRRRTWATSWASFHQRTGGNLDKAAAAKELGSSWASGNRQKVFCDFKGLPATGRPSSLNELKRPKTFRAT